MPDIAVAVEDGKTDKKAEKKRVKSESDPEKPKKTKCDACEHLAKSIDTEMARTKEKNPGGGNSRWEEGRLRKWTSSELRYVEVVDSICGKYDKKKSISAGSIEDKCLQMYGDYEEKIEAWFYLDNRDELDFYDYLCVNSTQICCPHGYFGKTCKPCPGIVNQGDLPCLGRGTCEGDGRKDGSGKCKCDGGWDGLNCTVCKEGYYLSEDGTDCQKCDDVCKTCTGKGPTLCTNCTEGYYKKQTESGEIACEKCDPVCKTCDQPGTKCIECKEGYEKKEGYIFDSEECTDIDECEKDEKVCGPPHTVKCVNNLGSYECVCKDGYEKRGKRCARIMEKGGQDNANEEGDKENQEEREEGEEKQQEEPNVQSEKKDEL